MVNYHETLVSALETILPVYYERSLTNDCAVPCISYSERNNYTSQSGNTVGYSVVSYQVKIWGNNIGELQEYALEVDAALRTLGWERTSSGELFDTQSSMIQKILVYETLFHEDFTK